MKLMDLIEVLRRLAAQDRWVVTDHSLRLFFKSEDRNTFNTAISRHVRSGLMMRLSPGVYMNPYASKPTYALEQLANILRPYDIFYLSLESALHDSGHISQIPSRLTFMTTGTSYTYDTKIGTIEFTHTNRSPDEWLGKTFRDEARSIRVANTNLAIRDLRRVNRSLDLLTIIDREDQDDEEHVPGDSFPCG